jgi:hypothetical protein
MQESLNPQMYSIHLDPHAAIWEPYKQFLYGVSIVSMIALGVLIVVFIIFPTLRRKIFTLSIFNSILMLASLQQSPSVSFAIYTISVLAVSFVFIPSNNAQEATRPDLKNFRASIKMIIVFILISITLFTVPIVLIRTLVAVPVIFVSYAIAVIGVFAALHFTGVMYGFGRSKVSWDQLNSQN